MDIQIQKELFLEKLSLAARFTGNRISSSPILQGTQIVIEGSIMHMYATDLNQFIHVSLPIEGTHPKTVCIIEPKKILEFIQLLPGNEVSLTFSEKQMRVSYGKTRGNFPFIIAEDFPLPPELTDVEKVVIDQLQDSLSLITLSASKDESRPVLTGISVHEKEDSVLFVTTDGFRLSLLRQPKKSPIAPLIIPASFFDFVTTTQSKKKKDLELLLLKKEKMIATHLNETDTVYTRMIEGEFPPYERVLPSEAKTTILVDRQGLLRTVKLVSVFAREFSQILVCECKKDGLYIRPKKENNQDNNAFQEAKITGEEQIVAFNFRYLLDFLNTVKSEQIQIEIVRPDAPVVFKIPENEKFLHIIMPVRIQE